MNFIVVTVSFPVTLNEMINDLIAIVEFHSHSSWTPNL